MVSAAQSPASCRHCALLLHTADGHLLLVIHWLGISTTNNPTSKDPIYPFKALTYQTDIKERAVTVAPHVSCFSAIKLHLNTPQRLQPTAKELVPSAEKKKYLSADIQAVGVDWAAFLSPKTCLMKDCKWRCRGCRGKIARNHTKWVESWMLQFWAQQALTFFFHFSFHALVGLPE